MSKHNKVFKNKIKSNHNIDSSTQANNFQHNWKYKVAKPTKNGKIK